MTIPWWFTVVAILLVVSAGMFAEVRDRKANHKSKIKHQTSASIYVALDVLRQIESGGNPAAVSRAGARGPYQLMRPAWLDAIRSLTRHGFRGAESIRDYDQYVCDETISRVIAHEYVNHVLPGYLTAARLDSTDVTGPVPDSLDARLAAWNAGAMTVRRAYAKSPANWMAHLPFETREFISRYHREQAAAKQKSQI